jgi:hypothetical protein
MDERPKAPGLKWRKRKKGPEVPYWFADEKAVAKGYPVKSANLKIYADRPVLLVERADRLQTEMLLWMSGQASETLKCDYDGTFKSILTIYQTDPASTYFTDCNDNTRSSYDSYVKRLVDHIGDLRIDYCDGRDVKRWFGLWRAPDHKDDRDHLPRARMALAVLKAAVRFGIVSRFKGCGEFKAILDELEFEAPDSRSHAPTAEQIIAARKAAHAAGAAERALVYAIQFETTLRQWDVTGQWVKLSDPRPSAVLAYGKKWIGPTWASVGKDLILARLKPTKTEETTGVDISFDLSACPMVMEELVQIPENKRTGPLIVNPGTGLPYVKQTFGYKWREDFDAAKIPPQIWNRDLRAGGITEGGKAGASKDDRRKLAGHAKEETTEIYDRDQVEAHRRVMQARVAFREKNGS